MSKKPIRRKSAFLKAVQDHAMEKKKQDAWQFLQQGMNYRKIGELVGMSHSQVKKMLEAYQKEHENPTNNETP